MATKTQQVPQAFQHYRQDKRRIISSAIQAARKASRTGDYRQLTSSIAILQLITARRAVEAVQEQLEEQGIDAPAVADVVTEMLAGMSQLGITLPERVEFARTAYGDTPSNLLRMVLTEIADTARVATGVDLVTRPGIAGYVRYLNPPSCGRCAILAGRTYKTATTFLRHPQCDCDMIAVENINDVPEWAQFDPMEAFRKGQVTGLSRGDTKAIREGAKMSQVVNVRRKAAGLISTGGAVLSREGRITPEGIMQLASDREDVLHMLLRYGYIR